VTDGAMLRYAQEGGTQPFLFALDAQLSKPHPPASVVAKELPDWVANVDAFLEIQQGNALSGCVKIWKRDFESDIEL
jgi:hypothetical protein